MAELQVGQKLWFVTRSYRTANTERGGKEVTVEKVGRSWVHISGNYRIDKKTWVADGKGFVSPGYCVLSKEIHDAEIALSDAWSAFSRKIRDAHSIPAGVTIEDIKAASAALKFGGEK